MTVPRLLIGKRMDMGCWQRGRRRKARYSHLWNPRSYGDGRPLSKGLSEKLVYSLGNASPIVENTGWNPCIDPITNSHPHSFPHLRLCTYSQPNAYQTHTISLLSVPERGIEMLGHLYIEERSGGERFVQSN
jgi:hypothetical protein